MELRRLKARLKTAVRGHKLLKDKSDEMARRFLVYIRENKALREELEPELTAALRAFVISRAMMTAQEAEEAVAMPSVSADITAGLANVMGLNVPSITQNTAGAQELYPYGFISTKSGLDSSISKISTLIGKIIKLAEVEKACNMLADEIERTRRRVNALEYVMIPQIEETIKYITMKLDENERGSLIRLMKVKQMIAEGKK
jgi:V/A-type H+-transporting ATPase subunit D